VVSKNQSGVVIHITWRQE